MTDRRWLPWVTFAFIATTAHLLIDQHIGLFGPTSEAMSGWEAANIGQSAALLGLWLVLAATATHSADARRGLLWLVMIHAVMLNGLVAFIAAPPPSAAFPYQDIVHGLALLAGVVAAAFLVRTLPDIGRPRTVKWRITTACVLAASQVVGIFALRDQGMF